MEDKRQRIKKVSDLLEKQINTITQSIDAWQKYLNAAARFHKYSFTDQLLISVQNPKATLCAEYDAWQKFYNRNVMKGSKGTPLLCEKDGRQYLRFVFDISDTVNNKLSKDINVWQYNENSGIFQSLAQKYNTENYIEARTDKIINDNDLLNYAIKNKENSLLEETDNLNIQTWFTDIVKNSVEYIVLSRCNLETEFDEDLFRHLGDFNTKELIILLGTTISNAGKDILREIETEVKNLNQQEKRKNYGQVFTRGNGNEITANIGGNKSRQDTGLQYDSDRRGRNSISEVYDGEQLNLFLRRGDVSVSAFGGNRESGRTGNRNVGQEKASIFENGEAVSVHPTDDNGTLGTLSGNGQESIRDGGQTNRGDVQSRGSDRNLEEERPNEVGVTNEQHQEQSKRDNIQRTNLYLNNPQAEENTSPAFLNADIQEKTNENVIIGNTPYRYISRKTYKKFNKEVGLKTAEAFDNANIKFSGKFRIENLYNNTENKSEKIKSLIKEYGTGGSSGFNSTTGLKGYDTVKSGGITIHWLSDFGKQKALLSWSNVEREIGSLIKANDYITQDERKQYNRKNFVKAQIDLLNKEDKDTENITENKIFPPFYVRSYKYAEKHNEIELFFASRKANKEFSMYIEKNNSKYYKDIFHFSVNDFVKDIVENFGIERSLYMFANYINEKDGRFSRENISRSRKYRIKDKYSTNIHPVIINAIYNSLEDYNKELGIKSIVAESKNVELYREGAFYNAYDEDAQLLADIADFEIANKTICGETHSVIGFSDESLKTNIAFFESFGFDIKVNETPFEINSAKPSQSKDEVKNENVKNFRITEIENLSSKEKFRNNVNAIKTLITIESENRKATLKEQTILSKYVGWGGLADAFDVRKINWQSEYIELKELLTPNEYNAARSSTLNAHYTSPVIINVMYKCIENLGFTGGKILEPAMGNGRFLGCLPESLFNKTRLYGVETDSLTGRIAKQLYPNADIYIKGFEKTKFKNDSFDVAVSNVPFGNYRINDNEFKSNELIHDYFFKKSLNKVRAGGVVAFITSKGTLDKKDTSVREYLAERADLLGAVRLPNNAFSEANTEVTSDIIFLQKRDTPRDLTSDMPEWVNIGVNETGLEINNYFVNHPEMICGVLTEVNGRFGKETVCLPKQNIELAELLNVAVENIKGEIPNRTQVFDEIDEIEEKNLSDINPEDYRNFCYSVIDNEVYFRSNDEMEKQNLDKTKTERLKGMIGIFQALRDLINAQKEFCGDEELYLKQSVLKSKYDTFTKKFGLLSDRANKGLFREDDTSALLLSLENLNDKGQLTDLADIFTKRTIMPYIPVTHTDTANEALIVSISEKARVDLDFMSQLCDKTKEEIITELKGVIFENPSTQRYETSDEYLSGNIREKLEIAKNCGDKKYNINVEALTQVLPPDLKPSEISVQLGSSWVPAHYYEQFMYELLDTPYSYRSNSPWRNKRKNPFEAGSRGDSRTIIINYDINTATFGISNKTVDRHNLNVTQSYGTNRMNAYKIIEETLNLKPIKVMDYVEDAEGRKRAVLNEKETLLAQEKQNIIKNKFNDWIFSDLTRTEELCRIYNDKFNSTRPREYDGSHIKFGEINPEIELRPHQVNAIAHTLYGKNTLLAHAVGAGKTYEMVASAMESKRLGLFFVMNIFINLI